MGSGSLVWILEDAVVGELVQYGYEISLVRWTKDGVEYTEYLENDEFFEYKRIGYEDEEV